MDKLRAITYFCRTVEAKSFSAAAQSLDVVPSALSKIIAALEQQLGFKLLSRSTRKLALTDEGAVYYEQCRRIIQELEDAEALAHRGQAHPRGTLRVGLHPAFRALVLSELGAFLDAYPDLSVATIMTNSPAAVVDDGLDVVLRIGALGDSGLISRRIAWTTAVTCASRAYLRQWGVPHGPEDLVRHRAIVYARRDEEPNARWEFLKGTSREVVEVPMRVVARDGIGITDAALGGCGIARPYDFSVRRLLAAGQLERVLPRWSGERVGVFAVLPAYSHRAPAKVRACIEFFESLLGNSVNRA